MNYTIEANVVAYLDHYFFQTPYVMPDADATTFKVIAQWFASDCRHVYFLYNVVVGADPASFVYLGGHNCQWAKDKTAAYYLLKSINYQQFRVIRTAQMEYGTDGVTAFYYDWARTKLVTIPYPSLPASVRDYLIRE